MSPATSAATVTTAPAPACFRKPAPVADRSLPVPPRASARMPALMSVATWLCAGKSPETSVSQAGRAPTVPFPVCRRNFRVAVVFPATRCQVGVALPAIKSPSTGDAATVSVCVPLRRLWFDPPPAAAAMLMFTRSFPASSAIVSVTFVPSIRLIPRRVPMAAADFRTLMGAALVTSVPACVCAGRSPAIRVSQAGSAAMLPLRSGASLAIARASSRTECGSPPSSSACNRQAIFRSRNWRCAGAGLAPNNSRCRCCNSRTLIVASSST